MDTIEQLSTPAQSVIISITKSRKIAVSWEIVKKKTRWSMSDMGQLASAGVGGGSTGAAVSLRPPLTGQEAGGK